LAALIVAVFFPVMTIELQYGALFSWHDRVGNLHKYKVTPEDRVTFGRCIWREGKPRTAVGHTLIQRFASLYPKTYSNFSDFLRAYCQPINPRWFTTGNLHKARVARLTKQGKTDQAEDEKRRAKNRERYAVTPWEGIPEKYRELTDRILSGYTSSPVPTAVHFSVSRARPGATQAEAQAAALKYSQARKGLGPPVAISEGWGSNVNWFFEAPGGRRPPRVTVGKLGTIKGNALKVTTTGTAGVLFLIIASLLATKGKRG
jgi:hypothetical protein